MLRERSQPNKPRDAQLGQASWSPPDFMVPGKLLYIHLMARQQPHLPPMDPHVASAAKSGGLTPQGHDCRRLLHV
jgi:hypothetical protein